ncbi:MAG: acyl carrier protein [Candidatus Magnetoglobus multicellularis str. Araruama]|jgi:acyl carrier protein|uniref:Acyl carrier protein n=1 Tax=Candidatus Magnetoglobus multicellularis str. Araruama TaxID=890399 RepID=A0A1V1PHD6_9BACT|nr:MAG: acyl carrier protein [Candidatus Magnetoglobus multicellularis str. Araruama]
MEVQFLELFSEIVESENAVKMDDLLTDFEEWDSLAVLSVISMLDDEYGVIMGSKDMKKMKTVGDIFSFVMNAVK